MSQSADNASADWSQENPYRLLEGKIRQHQQQLSSQQYSNEGQPHAEDPTAQVAGIYTSQPQIHSAQPQRVFGQPLPIIGPNQFVLDEEFRAAAKKSPMLWAFVEAVDEAEKKWLEQVESTTKK